MSGLVGVIIAGGQASRMGNVEKPLLPLADRPILEHVINCARSQVDSLAINVNRNLELYRPFKLPLIRDLPARTDGPLLGIYSAMQWFHDQQSAADYLACFPADVPAFPEDIVIRLLRALKQVAVPGQDNCQAARTVAWCQTGDQVQPLFSLWPMVILEELKQAIEQGVHGPRLFFQQHPHLPLRLPAPQNLQFFNINTPQQLATAEQMLANAQPEA